MSVYVPPAGFAPNCPEPYTMFMVRPVQLVHFVQTKEPNQTKYARQGVWVCGVCVGSGVNRYVCVCGKGVTANCRG